MSVHVRYHLIITVHFVIKKHIFFKKKYSLSEFQMQILINAYIFK